LADKGRPPKNPRAAAALAVADVMAGRSLSDALPRRSRAVGEKDRGLAAELAYGICRWQPRLQPLALGLLQRPPKAKDNDVLALLMAGLHQLLNMRVPAHAAVGETAGAARALGKPWAVKLVNASLRTFQRDQAQRLEAVDADPAARLALPGWLHQALREAWPDQLDSIARAMLQHPPMTLRVNRRQFDSRGYAATLMAAGITARPVPCAPEALTLDRPLDVDRLPGFADGAVSVQDAGAQLAAGLLDAEPGQRVLDACAAPGGKTAHLLETVDDLAMTAVDIDPARLERVGETLQRLGLSAELAAVDVSAPPAAWREHPFDRILLDAPCSATGVIRRHPDIRLLRRAGDIEPLAQRQAAILDALWPCLKPGGKLLYVTCSILPAENAQQIDAFLRRQPDARPLPLPGDWGRASGAGRQTLPGENGMDGFFYALLERRP
jgi:16S rRNA (cytosine967-C5)-methyltransferase